MKFNPAELIGILQLVGGLFWGWATYKSLTAPAGLAAIDLGIMLILLGGFFGFLLH